MYLAKSSLHLSMPAVRSPTLGPPSFTSSLSHARHGQNTGLSSILKALREGMSSVGLREEKILFGIGPASFGWGVDSKESYSTSMAKHRPLSGSWSDWDKTRMGKQISLLGDIFVVKAESLDVALWKIGGAAVGLRLVDLAKVNRIRRFCAGCRLIIRPIDTARTFAHPQHSYRWLKK